MREEIILIGPMGVGKTHTAKLLSKKLNKPHILIDKIRFDYYNQIGYDSEKADKLFEEKGFSGIYHYWKPFELYAIKKILTEYSDCIFDFGAGHSVYEDDKMFNEAKELLADFKHVILMLPTSDIQESLDFLAKRSNEDAGAMKHFMSHHSNYDLCKHIVYVKNKSEDDIVKEVIDFTLGNV